MPTPVPAKQTRPLLPFAIGSAAVLLAIAGLLFFSRPAKQAAGQVRETANSDAKAYLPHLALSNVKMQASENFMRQQVIEITGRIQDAGPRPLQTVDVFCLFYGLDGREIHRERLPIVNAKSNPLKPGETRSFRLPFDSLPDGWNQSLPKMVIAQITFADR
ncbi:MAG TPA: hypothetical protein VHZ55_28325 [Bryobacteraceae bacterium]|jgi:hypothetical protein|nr:hypothetical protein [Bryobacteraceae bacterium]